MFTNWEIYSEGRKHFIKLPDGREYEQLEYDDSISENDIVVHGSPVQLSEVKKDFRHLIGCSIQALYLFRPELGGVFKRKRS